MRALVTGAAGFIGSHLAEELLGQGAEVVALDSFSDYYPRWIKELNRGESVTHPRCSFIEGDLIELDLPSLLRGVDFVFHQAAQPGVRASWGSAFEAYVRNNISATQRLLEAARDTSIRKFVYASSSSIYGETDSIPTRESAVPRPISPYGVTKLAAEHLCSVYNRRFGVPVVTLRYFTAYGPRQRPDMAFHMFIRALLADGAIEIYGDGGQSRDFTYVADVVAANLLAAERGAPGRIYNIGGGAEVALNQAIDTLKELTRGDAPIHYKEQKAGDPRRTAADTTLARRELNYRPQVDLGEGLRRQIDWLKALLSSEPEAVYQAMTSGQGKR